MNEAYFQLRWPSEGLALWGFAHQVMNYRYHWHQNEYELSILLGGSQEFCLDRQSYFLEEDDVILIGPGTGHASFGRQADTCALVFHISQEAFKPFSRKGCAFQFPHSPSGAETRQDPRYCRIRFYAAQICQAALFHGPFSDLTAKASAQLLLATMCTMFDHQTIRAVTEMDKEPMEAMRGLITYMEQHYREKITLDELAAYSGYNRTYISTLFKNTIGINFYEYLTRLRLQQAIQDLTVTSKNLTDIALDNGFPDLKSFNTRFKEVLHRSPSQYRSILSPDQIVTSGKRRLISEDHPILTRKLAEYLRLPSTKTSP